MQPASEPPFDFAHLIDVQPFLSTARDGDFALTIDSIERYEHGFVLVLWAAAAGGQLHLFAISARDDLGNDYLGRMVAGHGGGAGERGSFSRVVYSCTPPLDPAARTLTLTVTHARRLRFSQTDERGTQPEDVLGGPWEFTFDLGRLPVSGAHTARTARSDTEQRPSNDVPPFDDFASLPEMTQQVAHGPEGFVPPPRFEPSQLRRVIAVAQQQEVERFAITVLSLEIYTDGFAAIVRTDYPEPSMHLPHPFHWQAEDDHGNRYWPRGAAGSGGGRLPQETSWRVDCQFTPALNPDARQLRFWLDEAEFSNAPFGLSRPTRTVEISGRWEFAVAL